MFSGYPSNIADGELMSNILASKSDVRGYIGQAWRGKMMQDCSDGPWMQSFTANTELGYVTSMNSCGCEAYMLYEPYFEK